MRQLTVGVFDPDTIAIMLAVLDDLSATLNADESMRQRLARRLLEAAKDGERDPRRLREQVLAGFRG